MINRASGAAVWAVAVTCCAADRASSQLFDYTDAAVVHGQPVRVVQPGSCAIAAGDDLTAAQSALTKFAQRSVVRTSVSTGAGLDIQYLLSTEVADDAAFVQGLELAAQLWESNIDDPIVVTIGVDFTSDRPYLAAASTTLVGSTYETLRGAIVGKAGAAERAYLARVPVVMSVRIPTGFTTTAGMSFFPPSALRRALRIENWTPTTDAQIVFNTDYTFDTNPSNGITPGQIDLVTVMCHELGHTLGFTSSIDSNGLLRQPLDMFRYGTLGAVNDPSSLPDITDFAREWRPGVEAALDTVGAILGVPMVTRFSTGATNGDGRQASHWKDDSILGLSQAIGVMDPTYQTSQLPPGVITDADRLALSLIGWDIDVGLPPCEGDADGDGDSDLDDLQVLLFQFGTPAEDADLNFDGVVDIQDLQTLLYTFGDC